MSAPLAAVIAAIPGYAWALDAQGRVIAANDDARAQFPKALPGTLLADALAPEDRAALGRAPASSAGRVMQWSFKELRDDNVLIVVAVDASETLSRARYFEQILDAIPGFILVKGPKSRLRWANRAFREFYAMTNEQLQELIDAPFNEPDYTKQYVQDDLWVWTNERAMVIDCEPVTRADGVVRRFETIKAPIFGQNGEVAFAVGISRDITEKLEAEEKSAHASKMASLGEMAGGIAHEINNPMSVVLARAQQLVDARSRGALSDELLDRALSAIVTSGERVAKIVRGLRRFSREGSSDPFEDIALSTIVEDTLTLCRTRFAAAEIAMRLPEIPSDLLLHCRPVQISQVLLNLWSNAFDAIIAAGPSPSRWVELRVDRQDDLVALRVLDSGPGVPEAIENRILQPFFSTKPAGQGTGLGLAIAAAIAKEHGGALKLDRSVSASCFVLTMRAS